MIEVKGVVKEVYKRTFVLTRDGRELKKREFTIEPDDDSDGEVYFVLFPTMWYDPVDDIKTGDRVKVVFSARSRKYNGKYYTTLTAKKVETIGCVTVQQSQQEQRVPSSMNEDDLPF